MAVFYANFIFAPAAAPDGWLVEKIRRHAAAVWSDETGAMLQHEIGPVIYNFIERRHNSVL